MRLRSLSRREQNLLIRLRTLHADARMPGAGHSQATTSRHLHKVVAEARHAGLTFHTRHSAFVGPDEMSILATIGMLQRPLTGRPPGDGSPLIIALHVCAQELQSDGQRLTWREHVLNSLVTGHPGPTGSLDRPTSILPPKGTLKRSLVEQLLAKGSMTAREIQKLGISRSYLATLLSEGTLMRGFGRRYRLRGPDPA